MPIPTKKQNKKKTAPPKTKKHKKSPKQIPVQRNKIIIKTKKDKLKWNTKKYSNNWRDRKGEREKWKKANIQKVNDKMTDQSPNILINIWNINGLNHQLKDRDFQNIKTKCSQDFKQYNNDLTNK